MKNCGKPWHVWNQVSKGARNGEGSWDPKTLARSYNCKPDKLFKNTGELYALFKVAFNNMMIQIQIIYVNLRSDTFGQHKDSDLTKRTLRAIPSQLWSDGRIHVLGDKLLISFDNIIRLIMIGMQMKIAQVSNVARNIPSYGCESCGVLPVAATCQVPDAIIWCPFRASSSPFHGHFGGIPHFRCGHNIEDFLWNEAEGDGRSNHFWLMSFITLHLSSANWHAEFH